MGLQIGFPPSAAALLFTVRSRGINIEDPGRAIQSAAFDPISENQSGIEGLDSTYLQEVVSQINESVQSIRRELNFSVDDESGRLVVKVINTEDGETIRQIPSEEVLRFARMAVQDGSTEGRLLEVTA
ncbi:MAG: flagellar protein FlaG [Gammaproteobacteria bacterium]